MPDRSGRRHAAYVPADVASLEDAQLSAPAFRLLLGIRRWSDQEITDGQISELRLESVAIGLGQRRAWRRFVAELVALGYLIGSEGDYFDAHFLTYCKSASQRDQDRRRWRESKQQAKSEREEPT